MGVVYKDEDTDLGRFVALKFLPDDLARDQQALVRGLSAGRRDSWVYVVLSQAYVCLTCDYGWCRSAHRGRIVRDKTLHMAMRYSHLAPDFTLDAVRRMEAKFRTDSTPVAPEPIATIAS